MIGADATAIPAADSTATLVAASNTTTEAASVDYMKLGELDSIYYNDAIQYLMKHKEIADVAGKFLAHINLGIIYNAVVREVPAATIDATVSTAAGA
jgi:hypothetical protein